MEIGRRGNAGALAGVPQGPLLLRLGPGLRDQSEEHEVVAPAASRYRLERGPALVNQYHVPKFSRLGAPNKFASARIRLDGGNA